MRSLSRKENRGRSSQNFNASGSAFSFNQSSMLMRLRFDGIGHGSDLHFEMSKRVGCVFIMVFACSKLLLHALSKQIRHSLNRAVCEEDRIPDSLRRILDNIADFASQLFHRVAHKMGTDLIHPEFSSSLHLLFFQPYYSQVLAISMPPKSQFLTIAQIVSVSRFYVKVLELQV